MIGRLPDGMTALRIGDAVIAAQLPQQLPAGTTLQLQVKTAGIAPQLTIVGTPQLPAAGRSRRRKCRCPCRNRRCRPPPLHRPAPPAAASPSPCRRRHRHRSLPWHRSRPRGMPVTIRRGTRKRRRSPLQCSIPSPGPRCALLRRAPAAAQYSDASARDRPAPTAPVQPRPARAVADATGQRLRNWRLRRSTTSPTKTAPAIQESPQSLAPKLPHAPPQRRRHRSAPRSRPSRPVRGNCRLSRRCLPPQSQPTPQSAVAVPATSGRCRMWCKRQTLRLQRPSLPSLCRHPQRPSRTRLPRLSRSP